MLFDGCNCVPGLSSLTASGVFGADSVGFVSAMISAMVASAQTRQARAPGHSIPEVDRLAVRMIIDNVVIQFVQNEKRDGLTIERKGGNTTSDAPPRTILHGEWGLSMHAESRQGGEVRNVLIDFGYTPETLLNNMSILKIDPCVCQKPKPCRNDDEVRRGRASI